MIKDALAYGETGHVNVLVHVNVNDPEQRLDMPYDTRRGDDTGRFTFTFTSTFTSELY